MRLPDPLQVPLHPQERKRLAVVERLGLLDPAPDDHLDALAEAAARALGYPVAFVSVVGAEHQVVRATHGTDHRGAARELSPCAWAVAAGSTLVVGEVADDPRFAGNALVEQAGWRAYVAAPLVHGGLPVGTLVVADTSPRTCTPEDVALLERLADLAAGRLASRVPAPRTPQRATARRLRAAVTAGQVDPQYVPVVALADRRTHAVEAVLGWRGTASGLPQPADVASLVDQDELLAALDRELLTAACAQVAAWRSAYPSAVDLGLSVAVSGRHVGRGLVEVVVQCLERSGLPAEVLTLAVGEGLLLQDADAAVEALQALRALGVGIALRDFGRGYATLGHLQRLPVTRLDLHRDFVAGLQGSGPEEALLEAVLQLAERLGLDVVAEGVSDEAQAARLLALGCAQAQGPLLGAAGDAEAFETGLRAASASTSMDVWGEILRRRRDAS